jgi:uncharacterized protein YkwD
MLPRAVLLVVAMVALLASATAAPPAAAPVGTASPAATPVAGPSLPGAVPVPDPPPVPEPAPAPDPSPMPTPSPAGPTVKPVPSSGDKVPDEAIPIDDGHKDYRHKHCAHWLRWSAQLADAAQERVDAIAKACKVTASEHSYGENLWSGTLDKFPTKKVVDSWYSEGRRYSYKRAAYTKGAARFTQMLWKSSNRYGCATANCKRTTYWICLYDPAGNVDGEFAANVKSPSECKDRDKE